MGSLFQCKRISIYGSTGSGKSYLAVKLGQIFGLPVFHLDEHYWKPNWAKPDPSEWKNTIEHQLKKPYWIMDGNFPNAVDIESRFQHSDLIICLNFNNNFYRASMKKDDKSGSHHKPAKPPNLLDDLISLWPDSMDKIRSASKKYPQTKFYELTSRDQVDDLIAFLTTKN